MSSSSKAADAMMMADQQAALDSARRGVESALEWVAATHDRLTMTLAAAGAHNITAHALDQALREFEQAAARYKDAVNDAIAEIDLW